MMILLHLIILISVAKSHPTHWSHTYLDDGLHYKQPMDVVYPTNFGVMQPNVRRESSRRIDVPQYDTTYPAIGKQSDSFNPEEINLNSFTVTRSPLASSRSLEKLFLLYNSEQPVTRTARESPTSLGDIVSTGIKAGFDFLDNAVPQINTQDYEQLITTEEPLNATDQIPMENKMGSASTNNLEDIIADLRRALETIKAKKIVEEEPVVVTNTTSTEEIIKHISASVDSLMKTRNNETRMNKIKEVSNALDILLNRIARSATEVISKRNVTLPAVPARTNPELMAKIVKHVTQVKAEALLEKLRNSGAEMTSKEVDVEEILQRLRQVRQQDDNMNDVDADVGNEVEEVTQKPVEITTTRIFEVTARQQSQEQSSEEGGGNLVANLLSSFLGSLSKPDGGVDVDAIVGLVSGLSVLKDDGTYDFSGLTDTLQSFLGGDEDGGGGSDVGSFLGGLLGAIIQGSANPPGPVGTGKLTGNLLANILPGLSGPAPVSSSEENMNMNMNGNKGGLDSGSFLAGLLSSMLGASSGSSSGAGKGGNGGNGDMNGGMKGSGNGSASFLVKIKNGIFKSVISIITSVISSSSGASSSSSSGKGKN